MDVEQVAKSLAELPLRSTEEALDSAPDGPGFYAWWCTVNAIPSEVPTVRHPDPAAAYALLYVGIAPNSALSASTLRMRIRNHIKGNIGSSTFRLSLAALLWEREGWWPKWTDRPILESVHLAALAHWQREHLRVQWCEAAKPWTSEAAVIVAMQPPLNRQHNEAHTFYPTMGAARDALRDAGRHRDLGD